jgi:hypothetical protein
VIFTCIIFILLEYTQMSYSCPTDIYDDDDIYLDNREIDPSFRLFLRTVCHLVEINTHPVSELSYVQKVV